MMQEGINVNSNTMDESSEVFIDVLYKWQID